MVRACEKGDLDSVKALVEGHDVEKTGMSVDEMVSKEGKNSLVTHDTHRRRRTNGHTASEYLPCGMVRMAAVVHYGPRLRKG